MKSVGLALKPERYDALTVEHIPLKYWQNESALNRSKWWDYRIMHPMQATYHFVDAYKRAYKAAYSRRSDSEAAQWLKVFAHDDFLEGAASTRTALWLARQQADKLGCPYEFFCNRAMQYAERRDWSMLPRPQAMYSTAPMFDTDLTIAQHVERAWQTKCKDQLQYSRHEFYQVDSYINNVHQFHHVRMLLDSLEASPNKHLLAATLIYDHKVLTADLVEQSLPGGNDIVTRAKRFAV